MSQPHSTRSYQSGHEPEPWSPARPPSCPPVPPPQLRYYTGDQAACGSDRPTPERASSSGCHVVDYHHSSGEQPAAGYRTQGYHTSTERIAEYRTGPDADTYPCPKRQRTDSFPAQGYHTSEQQTNSHPTQGYHTSEQRIGQYAEPEQRSPALRRPNYGPQNGHISGYHTSDAGRVGDQRPCRSESGFDSHSGRGPSFNGIAEPATEPPHSRDQSALDKRGFGRRDLGPERSAYGEPGPFRPDDHGPDSYRPDFHGPRPQGSDFHGPGPHRPDFHEPGAYQSDFQGAGRPGPDFHRPRGGPGFRGAGLRVPASRGAGIRGAGPRGLEFRMLGPRGPEFRGPGPRGPGFRGPGPRGPEFRGPGPRGPEFRRPAPYGSDLYPPSHRGRGGLAPSSFRPGFHPPDGREPPLPPPPDVCTPGDDRPAFNASHPREPNNHHAPPLQRGPALFDEGGPGEMPPPAPVRRGPPALARGRPPMAPLPKPPLNSVVFGFKHSNPIDTVEWLAPKPGPRWNPSFPVEDEYDIMPDLPATWTQQLFTYGKLKMSPAERFQLKMDHRALKLRRSVTPKNSIVTLLEVCPKAVCEFRREGKAYVAEITVNDEKFVGTGDSKAAARALASELALQAQVKSPTTAKDFFGFEYVRDQTPWLSLACFAMHKLFCDWQRGRIGAPIDFETATEEVIEPQPTPPPAFVPPIRRPEGYHGTGAPARKKKKGEKGLPKVPQKKKPKWVDIYTACPEKVLYARRGDVKFVPANPVVPPGTMQTAVLNVKRRQFSGRGLTRRLAKREAIKAAVKGLYGLDFSKRGTFEFVDLFDPNAPSSDEEEAASGAEAADGAGPSGAANASVVNVAYDSSDSEPDDEDEDGEQDADEDEDAEPAAGGGDGDWEAAGDGVASVSAAAAGAATAQQPAVASAGDTAVEVTSDTADSKAAGMGGDGKAAGAGGDGEALGAGGDSSAAGAGGDGKAAGAGGDGEAVGAGGDSRAAGAGGDVDTSCVDGNAGGDAMASVGGGGDSAANTGSGDRPQKRGAIDISSNVWGPGGDNGVFGEFV